MGGIIGFLAVFVVVGTLLLTGLNGLGEKKASDVFVFPKIDSLISLPPPPSGGIPVPETVPVPDDPFKLKPVQVQSGGGSNSTGNTYNYYTDPSLPKPPEGFTQDQLSSYYDQVSLSSFSPYRSSWSLGGFSLFAAYQIKTPINITGWKLKSNKGESVEIPRGASDYHPLAGGILGDIILQSGDSLEAYTSAPAFVQNVRLNKCMGYLNSHVNVNPSFPSNCPREVERSEVARLPGQCQDYLLSLSSCMEPTIKTFNDPNITHECIRFIQDRLSYQSCYQRHRGEADFFSKTWRIWTSPAYFDKTHDRVQLLDKEGKLVDIYAY